MSLPEFFFERITDEVRQQMDGVLALAQRLGRQPLSGDAQTCIAGIVEAAETVRRVVECSQELRAATAQDLSFSPAPRLLREIVDEVQLRWERRAAENGVSLSVSYDGHPEALADVDSERVLQVFDGFIAQAVAGTRRGGIEASLRASQIDGQVLKVEGRVRDSADRLGASDKYDIQEIEARFGLETALGVALGHRIVKSLAGRIHVEPNAGPGETVVFELALPCAEAPAQNAPSPTARAAHVLIVDDNATNRMVAETLCEMFDCTSEMAEDGMQALEAARTGRFDLILMDIKMPRMDGIAASQAIRALPGRLGRVPIIALTANADPQDAADYLQAGMNGVVEKPMKPDNLLHALQAALGGNPAAAA